MGNGACIPQAYVTTVWHGIACRKAWNDMARQNIKIISMLRLFNATAHEARTAEEMAFLTSGTGLPLPGAKIHTSLDQERFALMAFYAIFNNNVKKISSKLHKHQRLKATRGIVDLILDLNGLCR